MKASGKHDDIKAHVVDKRLVIAIETDDGSGEPTRAATQAGFGAGRPRQGDLGFGHPVGFLELVMRNCPEPDEAEHRFGGSRGRDMVRPVPAGQRAAPSELV